MYSRSNVIEVRLRHFYNITIQFEIKKKLKSKMGNIMCPSGHYCTNNFIWKLDINDMDNLVFFF